MKVVISPDSFKGTLSAYEAAQAIEKGIKQVNPSVETLLIPVADGGEGTMEALVRATKGDIVTLNVYDPLQRVIEAQYGVLGDKKTCVIEMAAASGITLLHNSEKNPNEATTFGTGQLIKHALDQGFRQFIVCIGGSATNDAGTGMLRALGLQLLDENGQHVQNTVSGLYDVAAIDFSKWDARIAESTFSIACDVNNPLVGAKGATYIFGPQKGVKSEELAHFDGALTHWANVVERQVGIRLHDYEGAGAAGGMGSALIAFMKGTFAQGIELVLKQMNYAEKVASAQLIITGEGKSDIQTLHGKAPIGIRNCAQKLTIKTALLSGAIEQQDVKVLKEHFDYVAAVVGGDITTEMAMTQSANYLTVRAKELFETINS